MDPREKEKAITGLLRQCLSEGRNDSAAGCPESEILAAYFERGLAADEVARWETHFSLCARCRQQLAELARMEAPVTARDERERAAENGRLQPEPQPAMAAVALPAAPAPAPTEPHTSSSFWKWRWLAPTAAALAAAAIWIAVRPVPPRALVPERIAESKVVVAPPSSQPTGPTEETKLAAKEPAAPVANTAEPSRRTKPEREALPAAASRVAEGAENAGERVGAQTTASSKAAAADLAMPAKKRVAMERAAAAPAPNPPPSAAVSNSGEQSAANTMAEQARVAGAAGALALSPTRAALLQARSQQVVVHSPHINLVWRLGRAGAIERSIDGGKTWTGQLAPAAGDLLAGSAPSDDVCWVVGRGGTVLRTTDGRTWRKLSSPTSDDIVEVTAQGAQGATITTAGGLSYLTEDGGQTWQAKQ